MKKVLFVLILFLYTFVFSNWIYLVITKLAEWLANSFVPIRFVNWWNHFAGALFITNIEDENQKICINNNCKICHKKLRWFYWSHGHSFFIWPLTEDDKKFINSISFNSNFYSNLSLNGWFYTACEWEPESVYGYIDYKYNNSSLFKIYAGLKANKNINFKPDRFFSKNLQYVQWQALFGLITDTVAWIWIVWTNDSQIDNYVDLFIDWANNTWINNFVSITSDWKFFVNMWQNKRFTLNSNFLWNQVWNVLAFRGVYSVTDSTYDDVKDLFVLNVWRERGSSKQYSIYVDKATFSKVINKIRKKAEYVCRWRWQNLSLWESWLDWWDNIICINANNNSLNVYGDNCLNDIWCITNKTLIVKNWNIVLKGWSIVWSNFVNIFVDGGNLIVDINDLVSIDGDGDYNLSNAVTSGVYINGDIFVNWLLLWPNSPYFDHKLYINWRALFLNTIGEPTDKRVSFVNYIVWDNALWNVNDNNFSDDKEYVNLNKVFRRRCDFASGKWSDGVKCWDSDDKYSLYSIILKYTRWKNILLDN